MYEFLEEYNRILGEIESTIRGAYRLPEMGGFVVIDTVNELWEKIPAIRFRLAYVEDIKRLSRIKWDVLNIFEVIYYPYENDGRMCISETSP